MLQSMETLPPPRWPSSNAGTPDPKTHQFSRAQENHDRWSQLPGTQESGVLPRGVGGAARIRS